jgi:hypothetical protein
MRGGGLGDQKWRTQVQRHGPVPLLDGEVRELALDQQARADHCGGQIAGQVERGGHRAGGAIHGREVGPRDRVPVGRLVGQPFPRGVVGDVADVDVPSRTQEAARDRATDPRCSACHQGCWHTSSPSERQLTGCLTTRHRA